jgi:DNA-binding transcriptional regulator YdaS (Cro superfamily)
MTPKDVVEHFGGTQVKAAAALGISQASVSEWFQIGYVPLGRQYELQVLTGGRLRADPDAVKAAKAAA